MQPRVIHSNLLGREEQQVLAGPQRAAKGEQVANVVGEAAGAQGDGAVLELFCLEVFEE